MPVIESTGLDNVLNIIKPILMRSQESAYTAVLGCGVGRGRGSLAEACGVWGTVIGTDDPKVHSITESHPSFYVARMISLPII